MPRAASEQIESRYAIRLPADLRDWFDNGVWRNAGGAEFRHPLTPQEVLEPSIDTIWAGFLPPDMLPLIGNEYGDWLCMRIDSRGDVSEIVYWSHAGGDWTPYGRTLADALLYDAVFRVLYSRRPEFVDPEPPTDEIYRAAQWAFQWTNGAVSKLDHFWQRAWDEPDLLLKKMLSAGVAEVAARRDLIHCALDTPLKSLANPTIASELGLAWEPEFVSWIFDASLVPAGEQQRLCERFQSPFVSLTQQDWDAAEQQALAICRQRSDLGWAFDIAGWAAERRSDLATAIEYYRHGVTTSLFADDAVHFRTHWFPEGYGKFAAARLAELQKQATAKIQPDDYLRLFWENDQPTLRQRLSAFWLDRARVFEQSGAAADAYRCYANAGWDLGLLDIAGYDEIFAGLVRTASAAGLVALSNVAGAHQACLRLG